MPKGFTEQEKALLRQRLLEQGYKQFSAYGLKKTTVEELAAAAGISKGAFYLFYESKEALFMDVIEEAAEKRFRQELLAAVGLPGASPRGRLLAVLQRAFALFKTIPMLQFFTGSDYDVLLRRIPPEKLAQHVASDRAFFDELIATCQTAGIPIRVQAAELSALLYALALGVMHEDAWGGEQFGGAIDVLLELVAAYCLGEVALQASNPTHPTPEPAAGGRL
jgi:AcrR family transcriptional regulator